MSDKLTKKDLVKKVEELEKELAIHKSKTQLARNYGLLQDEYDRLAKSKKVVIYKDCPNCDEEEEKDEEE